MVYLIVAVVFGVCGWQHALHYERKRGYAVWELPAWAWGLIFGFSLLFGLLLWMIASRMKPPARAQQAIPVAAGAYAQQQPAQPATNPLPGWYADPSGTGGHRYWSGTAWTDRTS